MKGKKFLAGVLSAAMVLGTMALPVFADGENTPDWQSASDATVVVYGIGGNLAQEIIDSNTYAAAQWTVDNNNVYAKSLDWALKAVHMTGPHNDVVEIECRDAADVGEMTHGHVADSIHIKGNGAYLSGGERDLEVDTYKYNRTKCEHATLPWYFLDNSENNTSELNDNTELNISVDNLSGIGAWSNTRYTDAKVSLGFTYCKNMSSVYMNGTKGENNISLKSCTFDNTATEDYKKLKKVAGVFAENAGTLVVEDCSFNDVAIGLNINNKSNGTRTISVKDTTFTDCATSSNASGFEDFSAPLRFVTTNTGASDITIDGVTVDYSTGTSSVGNGDILLGDGRDGKKSTPNVKLTISGTAAEIQTQYPDGTPTVTKTVTAAESAVMEMPAVVEVNGTKYTSLKDAIAAAQDGDTVELLSDASGDGVVVPNNSNLTIDFNGFTYNIDGTTVGSSGTETNGFQLLKGSNITFKNGTITSEKAKILIQNYSDLTLENMTLDGSQLPGSNRYVLSNNCGNTVLKGNTNIIAKEGDVAFDCFYWPNGGYSEGVTVTLGEDFTGKIDGAIEKTHDNSVTDVEAASKQSISISGGTFTTDVSAYCALGFSPKLVNGKYVVDDSADTLKLTFIKHTDDERVYDIVLNGAGKNINRLNTVHFTFDLDNPNMTYAIKTAKGMSTIYPDNNEYVFYYDGKDGFGDTDRPDTAQNITIGTVTFDGFGKFTFKATAGKATATTTADNLVTEFVTTAAAGKGTLKIGEDDNMIKDAEIKVPTQKLTVNVAMEHNVGDNKEAYQDMTVAISGGDLAGNVLEYKLGDAANTAITKAMNGTMVASYQIKADLTKDRIYTVTVSGAGYRTSRYTVTMTEDKTMNFWNNDKTNEVTVIDDEKAKTTFLAGELVRDGKIDIYDLSAVVAYFGQKNIDKTQASKFAKYDLNRDGEIDIMDISIVLTSWGK